MTMLDRNDMIDGAAMIESVAANLREEMARIMGEDCERPRRLRIRPWANAISRHPLTSVMIAARIRLAERLANDLLLRARQSL